MANAGVDDDDKDSGDERKDDLAFFPTPSMISYGNVPVSPHQRRHCLNVVGWCDGRLVGRWIRNCEHETVLATQEETKNLLLLNPKYIPIQLTS